MSETLSLQDWLYYEYDIDPDDWKRYSKREKAELRAEYDMYLKSRDAE